MYYLIKSISGIFVTTMDKQEILSEIQKIESRVPMYYSGNTIVDSQQRLQYVNKVLNFIDTTFTKELYHVEQWKQKILQSYENENATSGYGWTHVEASDVISNYCGKITLLHLIYYQLAIINLFLFLITFPQIRNKRIKKIGLLTMRFWLCYMRECSYMLNTLIISITK